MGDKFDKLIGNFKVKLGDKEYPFSMSLRQRGFYNNLRLKMDTESLLTFLFDRFRDGRMNEAKVRGQELSPGELDAFDKELADVFLFNYERINTQVMIALGIVTQEQLDKLEEDAKKLDLAEMAGSFLRKTEEKGK